jgi:DNA-binding NarL/FixJ family response regulator
MRAARLVVVDDRRIVHQGIRLLLRRADDIQIVGEAVSGKEAIDTSRRERPDVVLLDVRLPDMLPEARHAVDTREHQVMRRVAMGETNAEIAQASRRRSGQHLPAGSEDSDMDDRAAREPTARQQRLLVASDA